jgi:hypothetical protein
MVSVGVGKAVAVSVNGGFTTAKGAWVETGICVARAVCATTLQAANTSTENTGKDLLTCNMDCSFLICYTINQKGSRCNEKSVLT